MTREALAAPRAARAPAFSPLLLCASVVFLLLAGVPAQAEKGNSCESCHSDPDFLVTNKKLYDYFQEWSASIHKQEGVTCDDCHGGDSHASDKAKAHARGVKATDPASGIYYKNVPETCGTCHDAILEGFAESEHFRHVEKKQADWGQGPTCVTCHGSINSEVLNVNSVEQACARCHNEERKNHPETPQEARAILNRLLSIQHFYRYIGIRAEPDEARAFFAEIDPRVRQLAVKWHTFDLNAIDQETREVLAAFRAKRDELRSRQPPKRPR